ncbi:MAG: zf-TFIIB domain-containing protein [Verrucomicrobiota bacterium]
MRCPVCNNGLTLYPTGSITVDLCAGGCGGIWFDAFELKKVDETNKPIPDELLSLTKDRNVKIDTTKKLFCPKCSEMAMMRHFFSARRRTIVDECPNCGGFWLDAGELAEVREEAQDEKRERDARQANLNKLALAALARELTACEQEIQAETRVAQTLKNMKSAVQRLAS